MPAILFAAWHSNVGHRKTGYRAVFFTVKGCIDHSKTRYKAVLFTVKHSIKQYTSPSIGTATNFRWVFSAGRFLQSAVASGTSNRQTWRTRDLERSNSRPQVWNDAIESQQRKVELWKRNGREVCRKWRLPRHFWVILHAVNLRHGTDGFPSVGRRAEDFFARKFRRLRPGLNPRSWVPKASTLTSRPPKPLYKAVLLQ